MPRERGIDILQAPTRNHHIIARDEKGGEHTKITHQLPWTAIAQHGIGTGSVAVGTPADDKLVHYTGDAQKKNAHKVNQNEYGTAVLSRHIGETPHIAQAYRRACRGKNHPQLASKIISFHYLAFIRLCKSIK